MISKDFSKILNNYAERIGAFASVVNIAQSAITMREIDKHAEEFKRNVDQDMRQMITKRTGRLFEGLDLVRSKTRLPYKQGYYYGWRLVFADDLDTEKTPLQLIANTLNTGRTPGVAPTGRAISDLEGIKFISRNLSLLSDINPAIAENMRIGGWSMTDEELILNDGTRARLADIFSISAAATSFDELKVRTVFIN